LCFPPRPEQLRVESSEEEVWEGVVDSQYELMLSSTDFAEAECIVMDVRTIVEVAWSAWTKSHNSLGNRLQGSTSTRVLGNCD